MSTWKKHMFYSNIDVNALFAPASLAGIDFSDHLNYWSFGYDALMVIDTAFYRGAHYHQALGLPDTLNYMEVAKKLKATYYGELNMACR